MTHYQLVWYASYNVIYLIANGIYESRLYLDLGEDAFMPFAVIKARYIPEPDDHILDEWYEP